MEGRRDLEEIWSAVAPARGRANELRRIFDHSLIPMVLVDQDRWHLDANPAARLFMRSSLAQMLTTRIDDLTPQDRLDDLERFWAILVEEGSVGGDYVVRTPDGAQVSIRFLGSANMLPGVHLFLYIPSAWAENEIDRAIETRAPAPTTGGTLSDRERSVLELVASGCDIDQIARELVLSPNTVKTHLRNAVRRMGARNRAHAIALAIGRGDLAQN